jgi:hypothetical protein
MMIARNIVLLYQKMMVNDRSKLNLLTFFFLAGGDQPLDETMPLKSLKQLCGRKPHIFIRYRERGDMDCDYVRVYPGILK